MAPSLLRGIHRKRDDCHPSMYVVPRPQESSSSWLEPMDSQPSPTTLSSYQSKLYLIDLDKLRAIIFVSHRQVLVSLLHPHEH